MTTKTKMYRPEGWKNPYSTLPEHMEPEYPVLTEWPAFEAGADAMLEGIKKDALSHKGEFPNIRQSTNSPPMLTVKVPNYKGYLVFIPEEA